MTWTTHGAPIGTDSGHGSRWPEEIPVNSAELCAKTGVDRVKKGRKVVMERMFLDSYGEGVGGVAVLVKTTRVIRCKLG